MASASIGAVSRMVMAVETAAHTRVTLLRALAGMHHTPSMAKEAASTLRQVMAEYPTLEVSMCLVYFTGMCCGGLNVVKCKGWADI